MCSCHAKALASLLRLWQFSVSNGQVVLGMVTAKKPSPCWQLVSTYCPLFSSLFSRVHFPVRNKIRSQYYRGEDFPGGPDDKESACNAGDPGSILGSGRASGKENGYPLSSILACRIPRTEEPGRLQSMRLQRLRHNWVTNTFFLFF